MADERDTVVEALDGISEAVVESFGGGSKVRSSNSVIDALNQIRKVVLESSGGKPPPGGPPPAKP